MSERIIRRAAGAAAVLVLAAVAAVAAPSAGALVGDCTPGSAWGAVDAGSAAQVVDLVNQHRAALGLSQLAVSPTLQSAAVWKSRHMAYYGYLQHDDPAPPVARTVADRLAACGYPIGSVGWGENIAYGYSTAQSVMNAWLASPGHKANIENASFRAIGVGVARASNGAYYWTQDFGTLADGSSTTPPPPPAPAAPAVAFTSGPAASTTSTSATFAWTTTNAPTSVTCALDGGAAVACSSPRSYAGLAAGSHRLTVRVENAAGSASASYGWSVVSTSPAATPVSVYLTSRPATWTTSHSASFAWLASGGPTSTTCSLDLAPAAPCSSPAWLGWVARGYHRFTVRVANATSAASTSYAWYVF